MIDLDHFQDAYMYAFRALLEHERFPLGRRPVNRWRGPPADNGKWNPPSPR